MEFSTGFLLPPSGSPRGFLTRPFRSISERRAQRVDAGAFVPDTQWVSSATSARFAAYPLSPSQVAELIRRTQDLEDLPLRRSGMRALLCMLYSTGLRLGEALRLRCVDADWKQRCFFIRMSKGRSRWVPFRMDLLRELNQYRQERQRHLQEEP